MNGQKLLDNAIFYERRKNWKKVRFIVLGQIEIGLTERISKERIEVCCQLHVVFLYLIIEG